MNHPCFKEKFILLAAAFCLCLTAPVGAEELGVKVEEKPANSLEMKNRTEKNLGEIQRKNEEMQSRELERLQQDYPAIYETRKTADARRNKISAVVAAFHQNKISAQETEQKLIPLMREELREQINQMDQKISALEKHLAFLKKAKQDPHLLVEKKINELLGLTPPTPEEGIF